MSNQEPVPKGPTPFDIAYVLRTTAKHQQRSVDISISKTFARLPEFVADEAKSKEVFLTLAKLHDMRKQIDDFQHQNSEYFKDK